MSRIRKYASNIELTGNCNCVVKVSLLCASVIIPFVHTCAMPYECVCITKRTHIKIRCRKPASQQMIESTRIVNVWENCIFYVHNIHTYAHTHPHSRIFFISKFIATLSWWLDFLSLSVSLACSTCTVLLLLLLFLCIRIYLCVYFLFGFNPFFCFCFFFINFCLIALACSVIFYNNVYFTYM